MPTVSRLFVGGPKDGHMVHLPEDRPTYQFHLLDEGAEPALADLARMADPPTFRIGTYHLVQLRGEKMTHPFFLYQGLTMDQALGMLTCAYVRKPDGSR